jgi:hypothetical protein
MIFRWMRQTRWDDPGGVTVFLSVCMLVLLGVIVVAVDGGSTMRATEPPAKQPGLAASHRPSPGDQRHRDRRQPARRTGHRPCLRSTGAVSVSGDGTTLPSCWACLQCPNMPTPCSLPRRDGVWPRSTDGRRDQTR